MIKGHGDADAVVLAVAQALSDEEAVVDEVVVRQRCALGKAGRAGGVLNVDRVVELERTFALAQLSLGNTVAGAEEGAPVLVEAEDVAQFRAARTNVFEHRLVDVLPEAAAVEQDADARLLQGILQFGRLVSRVDVDEDDAGAGGGVLDDDPLITIGRPDADAVAG